MKKDEVEALLAFADLTRQAVEALDRRLSALEKLAEQMTGLLEQQGSTISRLIRIVERVEDLQDEIR